MTHQHEPKQSTAIPAVLPTTLNPNAPLPNSPKPWFMLIETSMPPDELRARDTVPKGLPLQFPPPLQLEKRLKVAVSAKALGAPKERSARPTVAIPKSRTLSFAIFVTVDVFISSSFLT